MKLKKVLGYAALLGIGVISGAMIFSPEFRGKVAGGITSGAKWISGGKKDSTTEETTTTANEPEPIAQQAPQQPQQQSQGQEGKKPGYWKPRYYEKQQGDNK